MSVEPAANPPDHDLPPGLRSWQRAAILRYEATPGPDFLATATPGAGKTTFALTVARRLLDRRAVDRVIVVAPTDHLRTQWADAAVGFGLVLDPRLTNAVGPVRAGAHGYVTTYAQVAGHPLLHRRRTEAKRTLVVLDEIHHAGDGLSWGEAIGEAFGPARRRLALTGTPFRTKATERIPFVRYTAADGDVVEDEVESVADSSYGYRDALRDGVVRPVVFAAYTGISRWMNSAGEVLSASLTELSTRQVEEAAWRTALDPRGQWIPHVIAAADQRLTDLRDSGTPDAAGLMLATDQDTARAYAAVLAKVTGSKPVVVLSDDPRSSAKIDAFRTGAQRWIVAVRQVSEGVDLPRLSVCVWTTSYRTPLFFAQAVGRIVRARASYETATVFLPAVRPLLALAADLEEQRNYAVRVRTPDDEHEMPVVERLPVQAQDRFQALEAEAEFAHLLHGGEAFAAPTGALDDAAAEFLGLPGLLSPQQTAALLAARDSTMRRAASAAADSHTVDNSAADSSSVGEPAAAPRTWREVEDLRREVSKLVARVAGRTGRDHAAVHRELRANVPGPPAASASIEVLIRRRDHLLAGL